MIKKVVRIIALLVAVVYGSGLVYSQKRFLPNTYVDGIRLDGNGYEKHATIKARAPVLSIVEKDKDTGESITETIDLAKDANYDATYSVKELINAQNRPLWFMSLFQDTNLTGIRKDCFYNKSKLLEKIGELYCLNEENIIVPTDAHIVSVDGDLAIEKENDGCQISRETVENEIINAVNKTLKGETADRVDLTEMYDMAEIREDNAELLAKLDDLKGIVDKSVTVKISDSKSKSLDKERILGLLDVTDNYLTVNDGKVDELVESIYKDSYVSSYEYIDKAKLKSKLSEALLEKESRTISVDWIKTSPPVYSNTSNYDRNNSIEVSISQQTLYYYEDGVLQWTSPVVTAAPGVTPLGHFTVTKIDGSSWLTGPTWNEHVDYWIGFDPTGVHKGFHDASWRTEFGGEIYKTDPSHGCINMPTNMVAKLHSLVHIGTPVYIYE